MVLNETDRLYTRQLSEAAKEEPGLLRNAGMAVQGRPHLEQDRSALPVPFQTSADSSFVACQLVHVEVVGPVDVVELMQFPFVQNRGARAVRLDYVRIVRNQDEGAILALLEEFDMAAVMEARITDHHGFVD